MFIAIARFFGWDRAPPAPSPVKAKRERSGPAASNFPSGPNAARKSTLVARAAHDKSKAEGSGQEAQPAMAVIPRDAVHMPPPMAASPGLPPVDPATGSAKTAEARTGNPVHPAPHDPGFSKPGPELTDAGDPLGQPAHRVPVDSFGPEVSLSAINIPENYVGDDQISGLVEVPDVLAETDLSLDRSMGCHGFSEGTPGERHAGIPDWAWDIVQMELFPVLTTACEHSTSSETEGKKAFHAKDRETFEQFDGLPDADPSADAASGPAADKSLGVDPADETGLPRVTTPARGFRRPPQRVADRPRVEEWTDDELLTLPEAASLFWPEGPITTNTLRTAGRDGTLAITKVAGKFFTTPMAIRRMGQDEAGEKPDRVTATPASSANRSMFEAKLEEARRQGRERKRRQRAAKRPVAPPNPGAGR